VGTLRWRRTLVLTVCAVGQICDPLRCTPADRPITAGYGPVLQVKKIVRHVEVTGMSPVSAGDEHTVERSLLVAAFHQLGRVKKPTVALAHTVSELRQFAD
jgi:hypothetical protein